MEGNRPTTTTWKIFSCVLRKWTRKADAYYFSKPIILHQGTTSALKFYLIHLVVLSEFVYMVYISLV